jgi:gliding motility-associated-like protein
VSDENSCQVTGEATVDVLFEVEPNAGADTAICRSELPVILEGSVSGGAFLYWTILGDTIAEGSEVVITDTYSGTTVITLIGSNGICSATDTVSVEILESPDVDAGDDLQVFVEEVFTLGGNPTSTDEVTFSWFPSPTTEFDNTASNPSTFLFESQQFVLIVTDQFGCTSVDSVDVEVLPDLEITSGFTPNGDGFNDFWIIDNIELFPNMIVHVFNRWGVEVFQSQGYNREVAWDGNFNGSPLPSGTYYFTIELNDPRFPDPITGPLTIHR